MPTEPADGRAVMFHVRMTPHEREMLEQLAEEDGISASDWTRLTIRRLHRERFPADKIHRTRKGVR